MQLHSATNNRRRSSRQKNRLMSEINVTPFVDVMLVLLIIFMVTAPLLTAGVVVDLPEAQTNPLPSKDEPLEISVKKNGDVFLSETKIPLNELTAKLNAITKRKKDTRIFIRGDKDVNYGAMIAVMNTVNKAGFLKVGLVTQPPQ